MYVAEGFGRESEGFEELGKIGDIVISKPFISFGRHLQN